MAYVSNNEIHLVQLNPAVVLGDIDGQIVALSMESSAYLHLNSSASAIINLLEGNEPRSVAWLCHQLQQEYAVDSAICTQEVHDFIDRCLSLNLLKQVVTEPAYIGENRQI